MTPDQPAESRLPRKRWTNLWDAERAGRGMPGVVFEHQAWGTIGWRLSSEGELVPFIVAGPDEARRAWTAPRFPVVLSRTVVPMRLDQMNFLSVATVAALVGLSLLGWGPMFWGLLGLVCCATTVAWILWANRTNEKRLRFVRDPALAWAIVRCGGAAGIVDAAAYVEAHEEDARSALLDVADELPRVAAKIPPRYQLCSSEARGQVKDLHQRQATDLHRVSAALDRYEQAEALIENYSTGVGSRVAPQTKIDTEILPPPQDLCLRQVFDDIVLQTQSAEAAVAELRESDQH